MMQVWLPLFPHNEGTKARNFISRRIMLPFRVDIYPLGKLLICFPSQVFFLEN
jgi:hypothetical protein